MEYTIIYSPHGYVGKWYAVRFKVAPGKGKANVVAVVKKRELTVAEIGHFERLINPSLG